MAWYLKPLHAPEDSDIALPKEGTVTIGRRPGNVILCKDMAVSGQHCIIHCRGTLLADAPEVEDCSTNGSYVNEMKISKGQRQRLSIDDVVSLTKPPEEPRGTPPPRVQFRVVFNDSANEGGPLSETAAAAACCLTKKSQIHQSIAAASGVEVPATAPDLKTTAVPAVELGGHGVGGGENCFAQDLLYQEQQSKAKITQQLLQSQSKLEEERHAAEAASRELEKVRKQVAEERARRHEAEESRDRLAAEAENLRTEYRQLKELRASHDELKQRHEVVQLELQTRKQKCAQLEAAQEQLRKDLDTARESHQKASQQHAELQTRARQAQERSDRLQQQYEEAKREADWAQEQSGRIESELSDERKAREDLEEKVSRTKDQVGKAETGEKKAREELDTATAKRAELECQASSAHSDLESARAAARQAQQRLTASKQLVERLREAAQSLSIELKRRAEVWETALADNKFDGLEDALASGGPTFAQITCQVDSPTTKAQQEPGQDEFGGGDQAKQRNETEAEVMQPKALEPAAEGGFEATNNESRQDAVCAAAATLLPAASTSVLLSAATTAEVPPVTEKPQQGQKRSHHEPADRDIEEVAIDDDDDGLLAAATRETAGESKNVSVAVVPGSSAALPGCSTAWSLEVLDAAPSGDLQPAKRAKLNGE